MSRLSRLQPVHQSVGIRLETEATNKDFPDSTDVSSYLLNLLELTPKQERDELKMRIGTLLVTQVEDLINELNMLTQIKLEYTNETEKVTTFIIIIKIMAYLMNCCVLCIIFVYRAFLVRMIHWP